MDNPGAAWAVILSNPDLREGVIREAERSHRFHRAPVAPPVSRWLILVVRALASHPNRRRERPLKALRAGGVQLRFSSLKAWLPRVLAIGTTPPGPRQADRGPYAR